MVQIVISYQKYLLESFITKLLQKDYYGNLFPRKFCYPVAYVKI